MVFNYKNMDDRENLLKKIEELESRVKVLEKDLIHDTLTSLKTRAFFEEESKTYISTTENIHAGKRHEWFGFKHLSIIFFDIDYFKKINDTYGHDVGDIVLKKVAEFIKKSVRVGDIVSRWGGEEMVVLLLGANESEAKEKADKIREGIENLVFEEVSDLKVTISAGVSEYSQGLSYEKIIKNADSALYKAKETGRNKVVAFSEL